MTIESPCTYINQLNSSYPEGGADRSTADDHLRLIKATVLATFPAVTGPVTVTHTELNLLSGAVSTLASISALTTKFSLSISAVVTDVARISQTVSVVIAKVTSISAVLTAYSLSISAVVTDVARISQTVSVVVADMARISQTVSVVIARVATMSSSVATAQTDIARISVTVSAIWTRINTLSASVSLIQATILGGTYTPTVTGKTNITSVDAVVVSQYIRAGSQVFVSGRFTATPTSTGATEVYVELPIASNIAAATGVIGNGYVDDYLSTAVVGDATGDRAIVVASVASTSARIFIYQFSYTIA